MFNDLFLVLEGLHSNRLKQICFFFSSMYKALWFDEGKHLCFFYMDLVGRSSESVHVGLLVQ